ncbi:AzlC family ABC transporter permease [Halobaculum sp. MBLA0143]|uniref:AzlC family ABC transporter permease n=1 Tax=Halobaculum sp. MBLA0143 TaxID=3079933 RepID=UPI0035250814
MSPRQSFLAGARAIAPVLLGAIPFGLVAGAAAVSADLTVAQALGLSTVVFAGASQLAAIELLGRDAAFLVVVGTALVINVRLVMYSASIAPYFEGVSRARRALIAYLLTDQAYALSITRFRDRGPSVWYYLGTAVPLWAVFVVATAVGAVGGAQLPSSLPLGFAVPLVFLAVLTPAVTDDAAVVAAVVGGTVAVAGASLPLNLGLVAGALAGIAAGLVADELSGETGESEGDGEPERDNEDDGGEPA